MRENNISDHITYAEATKSQTAIRHGLDNTPGPEELICMRDTGYAIFEPVRIHYDVPIFIPSFFRTPAVNKKVGGSKTSDHPTGRAIDVDADVYGGVTNREIFYFIKDNLEFDQLIWEYGDNEDPAYVHASYRRGNNRQQVLRAIRVVDWKKTVLAGKKRYKTKYIPFK